MPRIVVLAASGLGLVVVLLAGWLVLAPGWAVEALQRQVETALQRRLTVAGGTHLELASGLAIRFDDISLAAAEGVEGPFVTAAALRLPITWGNLLRRQLEPGAATLVAPEITLAIDGIGRVNWPRTVALGLPATIYAERAKIAFRDERSDQAFTVSEANVAITAAPDGGLALSGSAVLGGQLARIDGFVKDLARITEGGSPADITLGSPLLSVDFSGRLATAEALGLAGTVSVSGPDLRKALQWSGAAIGGDGGLKAFAAAGALDSRARAFALRGASLQVDAITAKGDLSFDFRGSEPKLEAVLAADVLALDPYLPDAGAKDGDWGKVALGFAALRGLGATLRIETPDIVLGAFHSGPARLGASLAGGRLDVDLASAAVSQARLTLDGSSDRPGFGLSLKDAAVDTAKTLPQIAGIGWLAGPARVTAELAASGVTQQEMVSSLRGSLALAMAQGTIGGLDVPAMLGAVSLRILDGWGADATAATAFASLAASFTVADGIASLASLKLDSPSLTVSGTGDIDLLRRSLDLRVDPRLVTGGGADSTGLPVAVVIAGPWDRPRIYPDMAGILSDPKAAYDSLRSQGLPAAPTGGD